MPIKIKNENMNGDDEDDEDDYEDGEEVQYVGPLTAK